MNLNKLGNSHSLMNSSGYDNSISDKIADKLESKKLVKDFMEAERNLISSLTKDEYNSYRIIIEEFRKSKLSKGDLSFKEKLILKVKLKSVIKKYKQTLTKEKFDLLEVTMDKAKSLVKERKSFRVPIWEFIFWWTIMKKK